MSITSQHVTGFAAGVGLSALTFYLYKKNQAKIDQFLGEHGIQVPSVMSADPHAMTLKELIKAKEDLEDLIAEKEFETSRAESEND